jgi:hypothetical protein
VRHVCGHLLLPPRDHLTPPVQTPLVMIRRRFRRLEQPVLKRPRPPLVVSTGQQPEASFERDCVRKSRDFGRSTPLVMIRRRFRRLEQPVLKRPRPPLVVSTRQQPEASFERDCPTASKRRHDSLEQSFVAFLNAWTLAASTSGSTAATAGDSPGEDSTPLRADRLTRLQASRVNSEAAGKGTLFLERLRPEESRFRSLGEFPIGGFLCVTFVATEADTATPFGAIVNIPSVGSNNPAFSFLDCHSCGRLRSGRDRNPLSRAIAPGRVAFPLARRVTHRWIPVHHVCGHRSGYGSSFRSHCQHPSLAPCCCLVSRLFHSPPSSRPLLPSGFSSISQPPFSRPPAAI